MRAEAREAEAPAWVEVTTGARLHFGFLDPSGTGPRRFGGLGIAIDRPRFVARIERPAGGGDAGGTDLRVEGGDADRVGRLAARFCAAAGIPARARIRVLETIPAHVGLGSGTQTALALASGLARLHGFEAPPERLCLMMGRARRSGVGFHLFRAGGFVIEDGHAARAGPEVPPLLARHPVPEAWRILLVMPRSAVSVSGEIEEEAFSRMAPVEPEAAARIRHLAIDRLQPAVERGDLGAFGAALAEIQDRVGACFAPVQGGPFHPAAAPLIERLRRAGAAGAGQSSWGPAVYAFAPDDAAARTLQGAIADAVPGGAIRIVLARNQGAGLRIGR